MALGAAVEHGLEEGAGPVVDQVEGAGVERVAGAEEDAEAVVLPALLVAVVLHPAGPERVVVGPQRPARRRPCGPRG